MSAVEISVHQARVGIISNDGAHFDLPFSGTNSVQLSGPVVGAIVISILILTRTAAIAFFFFRRSKKTKAEDTVEEVDENPVYDMYYFADGDRVDYGNTEVQDENDLYGS